jgi:L-cysteine/cystine lyase
MTGIYPKSALQESYHQQFPALANKDYFNYGGQGPLSLASLEAIQQSYAYVQQHGPFSNKLSSWILEESDKTRKAIALELGSPVEAIALTEDVTVGCNIAMWGMDWQAGDHLLITDCEHPGIVATALEIARRFGVEVSTCPIMATLNQADPTTVIAQNLRKNTRLVVLSHLLWNTGQLLPIAEIVEACRNFSADKQSIIILVDAAQSVGSIPLNLTELGVDFYAFTGHKWWCGPEGLGGLYVSSEALESINPTFIGWRSILYGEGGKPLGWKPNAQRFEVATSAYPIFAGLRSAIALHQQWGTAQERYEQICKNSEYLWQNLSKLETVSCLSETPPKAGIVSFQLTNGQSHKQLIKSLEQRAIMLRTISSPDCARACVHYFTQKTEIDQLIEAIANITAGE